MDIATCMYHTGIDPESMKRVSVAKKDKHRATQRALLQYFKPENYDLVKRALLDLDREDLIGAGPDCLIPSRRPPQPKSAPARGRHSGAPKSDRNGPRSGYRWAARKGPRR
jgi:hypothetical protein